MAGIGDERWDRMKGIIEQMNAEEPSQDQGQGPATEVDEESVIARAKRQLGWQVTNPASYDAAPAIQASRAGTKLLGGAVGGDQPEAEPQQAAPAFEDNDTIARARKQLGL